MGCATGTVKVIVFILNLACAIVGLALITNNTISLVNINSVDNISNQNNTAVPSFFIGLGVTIFIISFLGCCGVYQRSQCMLTTYAAVLLVLFVIQLGLGIYGYTQIPTDDMNLKKNFTHELELSFKNYNTDKNIRDGFNAAQSSLHCCGVNGFADYDQLNINSRIPGTCCEKSEAESCPRPPKYTEGCGEKLYEVMQFYMGLAAYVALGICVTELIGAIFAICLVNSYRNEDRRGH